MSFHSGCANKYSRGQNSLHYLNILFLSFILYRYGGSAAKNPPASEDTQAWSLGRGDPLEKEIATHSSFLAWEIP